MIAFLIRIVLTVGLLIGMWRGSPWALYLIVTGLVVAFELMAFSVGKYLRDQSQMSKHWQATQMSGYGRGDDAPL